MKTPKQEAGSANFYEEYWAWFQHSHGHKPEFNSRATSKRNYAMFTGTVPSAVNVAAGFSGSGQNLMRVVKVEIYAPNRLHQVASRVIERVNKGGANVSRLWEDIFDNVHRHAASVPPSSPGTYRVLPFAVTAAEKGKDNDSRGSTTQAISVDPIPRGISLEDAGKHAWRAVTFHKDVFDLSRTADVERAAEWMSHAIAVFEDVLGRLTETAK